MVALGAMARRISDRTRLEACPGPRHNAGMTARRIDGKEIAAALHEEIRAEAERLLAERGIKPGLATVLVGEDPASHSYVRAKRKACERDGIASFHHELAADTSEEQLLALIAQLATDYAVHGILVQLPVPDHIDERKVIEAIPPAKDVDGFHPANLGQLGLKDGQASFAPCTPAGVLEMLKRIDCPLSGARAVVLGRSRIVGLPAAMLLLRGERDGHVVPLTDQGPGRRHPRSRHPRRGDRPGQLRDGGHGQAWRRRDRRGRQSGR